MKHLEWVTEDLQYRDETVQRDLMELNIAGFLHDIGGICHRFASQLTEYFLSQTKPEEVSFSYQIRTFKK